MPAFLCPHRLRRRPRCWLLAAALVTVATVCRAEDLLEVYRQARAADPVLAAADALRGAVREGVQLARAPLLPLGSAGLSVAQTQVGGSGDDRQRARGISAGLSQVVVDVGALARLKAAEATADAQDASYRAAEQALVVRVASAYFNALSAADALAIVEANEGAFGQQVEQAGQRFRNGLSAAVDLEQARAYHAAARASTIAARRALGDARSALAEITGVEPGVLQALREALPMEPPQPADPAAWVTAALAANPLLQAQQASVGAAERTVAAARAAYLPTVSANVGVGRSSFWPLPGSADGRTVTTLGVVLTLPLFSGGAQQSLVRQALFQRDGAQDELEIRRRSVARTVQAQYRSVVAGIGQAEAQRVAVEAARKALASTRVGQELGTQTMTDLLLAIQTLGSAQGAYALARYQFVLARLALQQAAGALGADDLAAVNALLQAAPPEKT